MPETPNALEVPAQPSETRPAQRRLRILHVIYMLAEDLGGPPRALATLARAQAERGDEVLVLPARGSPGPQTLEPGRRGNLSVHAAPTTARLMWYNGALKRATFDLAQTADLVHIHGTWRYHLLAGAGAARRYKIPFIVRPAGNLGRVAREHKAYLKRPYLEIFERPVLNRAAAIHCCSNKELAELSDLRLTAPTFIVPQPVESDLLDVAENPEALLALCPQLESGAPAIAYLGRISFIKNCDVLLECFVRLAREYPEWVLVMAGPYEDAKLVEALKATIKANKLEERVALPGTLRGGIKAALLRRAAVFAQPSRHENFGISVAEALLFGLPCVVSSGVALATDIRAGDAGVVSAPTIDEFGAALRGMLSDAALRRRSAIGALRLAERYKPAGVAAALDAEYRRVIGEGR
ncbi:MAG: glycosyltransferase [Phycisphaerae bacterium]